MVAFVNLWSTRDSSTWQRVSCEEEPPSVASSTRSWNLWQCRSPRPWMVATTWKRDVPGGVSVHRRRSRVKQLFLQQHRLGLEKEKTLLHAPSTPWSSLTSTVVPAKLVVPAFTPIPRSRACVFPFLTVSIASISTKTVRSVALLTMIALFVPLSVSSEAKIHDLCWK